MPLVRLEEMPFVYWCHLLEVNNVILEYFSLTKISFKDRLLILAVKIKIHFMKKNPLQVSVPEYINLGISSFPTFNMITLFQLETHSSVKTAGSGGILSPSEQMNLFSGQGWVVTTAFLLSIMAHSQLTSTWSMKVVAFWETKSPSTHI